MINPKNILKNKPSNLDHEIARLLEVLSATEPNIEKYNIVADQLVKLYKLKEVDSKSHVSPDALVSAGATITGILLVSYWEQTAHVIGSKAFGLIGKKFAG